MSSSLSMTTAKTAGNKYTPYKKGRLWWKVKTTPSGDMRLVPIKEKNDQSKQNETILVTMTSKMMQNDTIDEAISQVSYAGGNVRSVKGRRMEIEVDGVNTDSVGDVLDSFGCQWDIY